jgi:hypothetical protein
MRSGQYDDTEALWQALVSKQLGTHDLGSQPQPFTPAQEHGITADIFEPRGLAAIAQQLATLEPGPSPTAPPTPVASVHATLR